MQISKPTECVLVQMEVWFNEETKDIHLAVRDVDGFQTTVNDKHDSIRGHKILYMKLAKLLRSAGAKCPRDETLT